jgi:hypothetical protein
MKPSYVLALVAVALLLSPLTARAALIDPVAATRSVTATADPASGPLSTDTKTSSAIDSSFLFTSARSSDPNHFDPLPGVDVESRNRAIIAADSISLSMGGVAGAGKFDVSAYAIESAIVMSFDVTAPSRYSLVSGGVIPFAGNATVTLWRPIGEACWKWTPHSRLESWTKGFSLRGCSVCGSC